MCDTWAMSNLCKFLRTYDIPYRSIDYARFSANNSQVPSWGSLEKLKVHRTLHSQISAHLRVYCFISEEAMRDLSQIWSDSALILRSLKYYVEYNDRLL